MDLFTRADLRDLLAEREGPRASLFMSAHRGGAEEDPIRFRNLLGRVAERLGYKLVDHRLELYAVPINPGGAKKHKAESR